MREYNFKYIFCFLLLFSVLIVPKNSSPFSLPVSVNGEIWSPLEKAVDDTLQAQLKAALSQKKLWQRLQGMERMAVGVVDLTDPMNPRYAAINGDKMMYAASLPKIAVLLAAEQAIEDGRLEESPEITEDLANMIRYSSNPAASRLIDFLGLDSIADVLRDPQYRFYDEEGGGGLWVGRKYARKSERNPDPLQGLSHAATVRQVCRFYYMLATGRLVSEARSRQMLEMMSNPGINHKFVGALKELAPNAHIFRKSGTWRNWHSDSALIWEENGPRRYIVVGLVESSTGGKILSEIIPLVDRLMLQR